MIAFDERVYAISRKHLGKFKDEETNEEENLFHYTSSFGLNSIIINRNLWFSHINYLNDEGESVYTYKLLKKRLEKLRNSINRDLYNEINEKCDGISSKDYFVASFSTDPDNLSNWNYYTKSENTTGYNIEFDKNILISTMNFNYEPFYAKTIYEEKKQATILDELIIDYNSMFETLGYNLEIVQNINDDIKILSLFFKHPSFYAEKEYRIVICRSRNLKFNKVDNDKFRIHNGIFIPYIEQNFSPESVVSVTISPTQKQSLVKSSVEKFLKEYGYNVQNNENFVKTSEIPLRY